MKIKVKMKSLARKIGKADRMVHKAPEVYYPSLSLNHEELPGIEALKFGDKVHLSFDGEVSGRSMSDYDGKAMHRAEFKLKKGAIQSGKAESKSYGSTDEALDDASKESGGIGRIVKDFKVMSKMDA